MDFEPVRVVLGQVRLDLADQLGVVCAIGVQPEDGGRARRPRSGDGQLHPVAHRCVLHLAGAPNVALFDGVLEENGAAGVHHADRAIGGDLEGLVVGAVLLGLLRHQPDVRHAAHAGGVVGAVGFWQSSIVGSVDGGIAAVGDGRLAVLQLAPRRSTCRPSRGSSAAWRRR